MINNSWTQPLQLATYPCPFSFSTAPRIRLVEVPLSISVPASLLRVLVPDSIVLGKIVGTASGRCLHFFDMPKVAAMAESTSKESSVKCSLHRTKCFVGTHLARVLLTCFTHLSRSFGSLGNLYKDTRSLGVLEHPAATRFTIALPIFCLLAALLRSYIQYMYVRIYVFLR